MFSIDKQGQIYIEVSVSTVKVIHTSESEILVIRTN